MIIFFVKYQVVVLLRVVLELPVDVVAGEEHLNLHVGEVGPFRKKIFVFD